MIRTLLTLTAAPGRRDELVQHYDNNRVLHRSTKHGWITGEVSVDIDDDDIVVVTSLWPSTEHYDGWLADRARVAVLAELGELLNTAVAPTLRILQVRQSERIDDAPPPRTWVASQSGTR